MKAFSEKHTYTSKPAWPVQAKYKQPTQNAPSFATVIVDLGLDKVPVPLNVPVWAFVKKAKTQTPGI